MDIHTRNILIAVFVAFVITAGVVFLVTSLGGPIEYELLAPGAFFGALTFYALWNLSGNRKVTAASEAQRQQALSLTPPPGQALIYVIRRGFVAKAAGMDISLDRVVRAQIKAPQFTCFAVTPGTHELSAALAGGAGRQSHGQSQQLTLGPDEALGVQVSVKMGLVDGSLTFETLSGQQLQQTIRGMRMVAPLDA